MRIPLGIDAAGLQKNERFPVVWNTERLVNGHTILLGMPGTGKTHTIRKMVAAMQREGNAPRIHVFDVHGDIDIPGASEVLYSEQTPYGLNPLRVNPDMHYGGVRRAMENFISTMNKAKGQMGTRQEAVLRNVLLDVYRTHGFNPDDASTWEIDESQAHLVSDGSDNRLYLDVPKAEKDQAKAFGARWDPHKYLWWVYTEQYEGGITRWPPKTAGRTHPTLDDVVNYANRLLRISFMGSDQDAVTQLDIFNKAAAAFHRKQLEVHRAGGNPNPAPEDENAKESSLDKARIKAAESYSRYLNAVRTGAELDDLIKYDSTDILKSVVDRLEGLRATGIFKNQAPPFDPSASVWVHKLKPLETSTSKMFVLFRLQEIFYETMQRGQQTEIRDVLVIDEVHRYVDGEDSIISKMARESRKFGVAIIAANQDPNLPSDFVSSVGTKIILGIDEMFWKSAESKMNFERRLALWVQPKSTMAVQMKMSGSTRTEWRWVVLDNHVDAYVHRMKTKVDAAANGEASRGGRRGGSEQATEAWMN